MRSGSAVEAQWKRSGCAVLRHDCCDLKQKKTGVPMTAPQNRPNILRTPHHLYLREFCMKLGRNRGNRPNFAPVAFLVGTTRVAFTYVSYFTIMYVSKTLLLLAVSAAVIN